MNARRRYRMLVFDWDGTLVDSTATIALCIQQASRDLGLPVPSAAQARHVIGLGLQDSLRLAVPELPAARYPEFVARYRVHFTAREASMMPFAGVAELLDALLARGCTLAVATGKSRRGLDRALAATGLGARFAASRCADETHPKPHPAMLRELLGMLAFGADEALMVGDTSHDLAMAREAGVDSVAVSYGAHDGEALRSFVPRACVESVEGLRTWLLDHA